ncbi:MAG: hypothetical protein B6I20_09370 [Bacteroidetes bacterium 4572_117]|nr:MAG: hypothetical protein B6I20_09370 [Bacteroidetes bacterium 4572_117]
MKINFKDYSVLTLIGVNIFPIIGVIFFSWDIFEIVMLYVLETFLIGLFNISKMAFTKGNAKFFLIPFFLFHYNFFIIIQSAFVVILLGNGTESLIEVLTNSNFIIANILIIVSHGVSMHKNYINRKEYEIIKIEKFMIAPYKRIFVQQFTVIGGAFVVLLLKAPMGFLIILIIMKTFFDLRAHHKSHTIN